MPPPPLTTDPQALVAEVRAAPGELSITFPGGVRVAASAGFSSGDANAVVESLFGPVNAALAPLNPIFSIFDAIKAIFAAVEAIPKTFGLGEVPPDPTALPKAIPPLAAAVSKLLELYPPTPIVVMVRGILEALVVALGGLRDRFAALVAHAARVTAAHTRAAQLGGTVGAALQLVADKAQANLEVQVANANAGAAPLNRLLGVVNGFLDLAGLPCVPAFGVPTELTEGALSVLDDFVALLRKVLKFLPFGAPLPLPAPTPGSC